MTRAEAIKYFEAWRLMEITGSNADRALEIAIASINAADMPIDRAGDFGYLAPVVPYRGEFPPAGTRGFFSLKEPV